VITGIFYQGLIGNHEALSAENDYVKRAKNARMCMILAFSRISTDQLEEARLKRVVQLVCKVLVLWSRIFDKSLHCPLNPTDRVMVYAAHLLLKIYNGKQRVRRLDLEKPFFSVIYARQLMFSTRNLFPSIISAGALIYRT